MSNGRSTEPEVGEACAHWELGGPHDSLGWTLVGGGRACVDRIEWHHATSRELAIGVDPIAWIEDRIRAQGRDPARSAAFLTSRRLEALVIERCPTSYGAVEAVATVGLSNALRAGDPAPDATSVGTINLALRSPAPLTPSAHVEALAIGQEAKGLAMAEAGVASIVSRRAASGTGTDCAVVVAPVVGGEGEAERYAGKHTELGAALGSVAHRALERGIATWKQERGLGDATPPHEPGPLVLVGGGARSGKSAFAERRALDLVRELRLQDGAPPIYLATCRPADDEMRTRVARHREDRGDAFRTIEEPVDLAGVLERLGTEGSTTPVLVDCLTLWLTNLLMQDLDDAAIEERSARLVAAARAARFPVVLVTNEVGLGLVPGSELGRRFRDLAGQLHRQLSGVADEVYLAALGTVLQLRPGPVRVARHG